MAMGAVSLGLGMYGNPAKYSTAVGRTKKLRPFHFKRSVPVSCAHAPSLRTLVGEVAFNSSLIGRNGANIKYTWLRPSYTTRVAKESSGLVGDDEVVADGMVQTLNHIKASLYQAIDGINRGIFGVPSGRKSKIEDLVKQLESQNPTPNPTANLEKMGGCWKLLYSTITILGSKRTKLGLRDFISLGDFLQTINVAEGKAVNVIKFNAKGLSMLNGQLIIDASFRVSSESRVDISYSKSTITPDQMMNVFRQNYELLLGIFNPEGWLEITYVDDTIRIGRDNKGNLFILERSETP